MKDIIFKCTGSVIVRTGSFGVKELYAHIDTLTPNQFGKLTKTDSGRWGHHGGRQLIGTNPHIDIRGSRFSYEGEIHPTDGYKVSEFNDDNLEATFTIPGYIRNNITDQAVKVQFVFVIKCDDFNAVWEYRRWRKTNKEDWDVAIENAADVMKELSE